MSKHLTLEQEKAMRAVKVFLTEIAETDLVLTNCPLLHEQVSELLTLSMLMNRHLRYLLDTTEKS